MKRMLTLALALLGASLLVRPGQAQTQPSQSSFQKCADEARTQMAINVCASDAYREADAELNAAYQRVMAKLGPAERTRLRAVQRGWIAFRDGHCDMVAAPSRGGSIEPTVEFRCMEELTRERTRHLRDLEQEYDG
jgi:uncharacterized protein YecT (DUF1311 family)